jgi:hypothetical protein
VIAYRIQDGKVRVLLMTSRDTGRWIIPRGNIKPGVNALQGCRTGGLRGGGSQGNYYRFEPARDVHLLQEAGLGRGPRRNGRGLSLRVEERLKKWPERSERRLSWVSIKEAVTLVEEPGVVPLLRQLMGFEDDLANSPREPLSESRPP